MYTNIIYNMNNVDIGTCSWTEKTLLQSKEFYPSTVKTAQERLKFYASHFSTVEVDSAYYALGNERNSTLWAQRTPDNFIFHIKVYSALTGHGASIQSIPKDIEPFIEKEVKFKKQVYIKSRALIEELGRRFVSALEPLRQASKLGLLVFQFPPWFQYSQDNLNYILFCKDLVIGLKVGVEFRHASWLLLKRRDTILQFLKSHGLTYISADEPQYGNMATIPFIPGATTDTAYVRLHGRNKENWLKKGIETSLRYSYLYSDSELRDISSHVKKLAQKAQKVYVMFNNCHGGFAMRNALSMKELV